MIFYSVLFRYVTKAFLNSFAIVTLCFFFITATIESMDIIRRFSVVNVTLPYQTVIKLTVMQTIVTISSFFYFIVFLGTIVFFITMHSKLELTIIKIAGVSTLRLLTMLFFSAFIIGTFYITILDKVSACSVMKIKSIKAKINERDVDKSLTVTNSGIWLKDINGSESHIIYAKSFNRESASLFNVRFFNLNANNELQKSLYSREAAIFDGFWQLREAEVVGDSNEKQLTLIQIPTKLSFHDITKMVENPNSISFWSMKKYINMLDKTGLSSTKHKIYWLSKISSIVQMFTLIMFATVFCVNYNPRNVKRYVEKIALLLGMAFPMHFFDNVLVAFGENGVIPTDFSMFVVPIFTIATSCIFLHKS